MVGVKEKDLFEDIIGNSVVEAKSNSIINIKFLCTRSDVDRLRRTHDVSFFLSSPEYEYAMRFPVDAAPLAVQLSRVVVNGDLGTDQIMSFWFLPRVKLVIHGCLFSSVLLDKVVITSPMFLMRGTGCFFTSNVSCRVLH